MSETIKGISRLEALRQTAQTFKGALEKQKEETQRSSVDYFRTSDDGTYNIRVLPIAPVFNEDGEMLPLERHGYDYPVRVQYLKIDRPAVKGKQPKPIVVPVINTTQKGNGFNVGYPVDIIDKYVSIAKEIATAEGDDALLKKIGENSYSGGLKWQSVRAIYVLDLDDKRKLKLWQPSYSQYENLRTSEISVWTKLNEKLQKKDENAQAPSPLSDFAEAYPVEIIRKNNNGKTEYQFTIDTVSDTDELTEKDIDALFDAPRIPDIVYRYSRRQFEATVAFLKQCDKKWEIDVCEDDEFIEAMNQLEAALSKDDNSHFDINATSEKSADKKDGEITLDSMYALLDSIEAQDLGKDSEEYQDLRAQISQFINDNELDVRYSHSKTNKSLLEEIEQAIEDKNAESVKEEKPAKKVEPEPEPEKEEEEEAPRKRRAKPVEEPEPEEEPEQKPEPEPEPEPEKKEADDQPVRRRRRRAE